VETPGGAIESWRFLTFRFCTSASCRASLREGDRAFIRNEPNAAINALHLNLREPPGAEDGFTTVGGMVFAHLRRIPKPGDHFTVGNWRFEVVDMDGNRVDKILIRQVPARKSDS
jgi:Mg2+/Co2+ transporter CorB